MRKGRLSGRAAAESSRNQDGCAPDRASRLQEQRRPVLILPAGYKRKRSSLPREPMARSAHREDFRPSEALRAMPK